MTNLIFTVILILTNSIELSHAETSSLEQLFEAYFYNNEVYKEGNCSTNVWRFLHKANESKQLLKPLMVMYYYRPNLADLVLLKHRGSESTYFYHVVLFDGKNIYDFDFERSPHAINIKRYFKEQVSNQNNIKIKLIPAQEYLNDYSSDLFKQKNFYYYLLPEYQAYEEISLTLFLNQN